MITKLPFEILDIIVVCYPKMFNSWSKNSFCMKCPVIFLENLLFIHKSNISIFTKEMDTLFYLRVTAVYRFCASLIGCHEIRQVSIFLLLLLITILYNYLLYCDDKLEEL